MKTQTLFIALFAVVAFTACSNNATNNLLEDAKKAADLECRIKQVEKAFDAGDMSAFDDDTKLKEQLTLIEKKYESDKLNFLEAVDKEMGNCKVKETEETSSVDSESNSPSLSETDEDWDRMLDDYETFTDEYVKFYKKALKRDNSAFAAYPELMEKAETLQKSLEKAEQNKKLGVAQLKRMAKIQAKMLGALQSN